MRYFGLCGSSYVICINTEKIHQPMKEAVMDDENMERNARAGDMRNGPTSAVPMARDAGPFPRRLCGRQLAARGM